MTEDLDLTFRERYATTLLVVVAVLVGGMLLFGVVSNSFTSLAWQIGGR